MSDLTPVKGGPPPWEIDPDTVAFPVSLWRKQFESVVVFSEKDKITSRPADAYKGVRDKPAGLWWWNNQLVNLGKLSAIIAFTAHPHPWKVMLKHGKTWTSYKAIKVAPQVWMLPTKAMFTAYLQHTLAGRPVTWYARQSSYRTTWTPDGVNWLNVAAGHVTLQSGESTLVAFANTIEGVIKFIEVAEQAAVEEVS